MAFAADTDTSEFDAQRAKAQQQVNAQKQGQQDALKRRFSAMGGLNNGAYIKANENVETAGANQIQNANESINAAQNQELRRRKEFATGLNFQADQGALQREFATKERLGGQEFAGGQNAMARALQEAQMRQQGEQFGKTLDEQKTQANSRNEQFDREFAENVRITNENLAMAKEESNKPSGLLGSIFGNTFGGKSSPLNKLISGYGGSVTGGIVMGPAGMVAGGANSFNGGGGGFF